MVDKSAFINAQLTQSLHAGGSSECIEVQSSLLPQIKAVERLCIVSCKITVHVILSSPPGPYICSAD